MTTSPPPPRTLAAWIKALDGVRLPVPQLDHQAAREALADERRSLREIAELLQVSPVLVLAIMREANRSDLGLGEQAESLEAALTRIGLKRANELLARIPSLKKGEPTPAFQQLVLVSLHASEQSSGLFARRLARLWQEVHWSSLLFLAPVWSLVGAYPHLLEAWEQRVLLRGEPVRRVETDLLGVPLISLCQALAEHWRLPGWIVDGYRLLGSDRRRLVRALHIVRDNEHPLAQQEMLDADPELRRWLTLPGNTPVLANGIAVAAHHAWSGLHTLRWQRLAALYLQQPLPDLQQLVHQHAVRSARAHARPDLWHPALALPMPWESRYPFAQQTPTAAPAPVPENPALAAWRGLCAELLRTPSPFANTLQLTTTARDALLACGLQRVLLLQLDNVRHLLIARQSAGLGHEAGHVQLDPTHSQLLRQLMDKPRQLHLTPENFARFSPLLPGALKSAFLGEHLLLRSLACNGRPVLLAVADRGGAALGDTALQAFARTVQCIERALDNYGRRPR